MDVIPEEFCFPAVSEETGRNSCGEGFECSCQPPQSNIFDRSYLEGRKGCEKILYGRIGETNKGEPTSMYYGWLGFNNFPQTFFTVFQAQRRRKVSRCVCVCVLLFKSLSLFLSLTHVIPLLFQISTLSNWGRVMDSLSQSNSIVLSFVVFFFIIVVMKFWVLNIAVAVILQQCTSAFVVLVKL